ncbi:MAG: hypothetical protein ACK530_15980 [Alphaproteobacteria bacterium]|jgi:TPP-dependent indolepyruvate ferredoxin oxidoreductase alpha subunit
MGAIDRASQASGKPASSICILETKLAIRVTEDFWRIVTPRGVNISPNSFVPPTRVPAEKLVRDIRRATRKHYSAEDKIGVVLEGLLFDYNIEYIENQGAETVAFTVPFPTPPPLTQTCSQPWLGLEIPEYLRAFR